MFIRNSNLAGNFADMVNRVVAQAQQVQSSQPAPTTSSGSQIMLGDVIRRVLSGVQELFGAPTIGQGYDWGTMIAGKPEHGGYFDYPVPNLTGFELREWIESRLMTSASDGYASELSMDQVRYVAKLVYDEVNAANAARIQQAALAQQQAIAQLQAEALVQAQMRAQQEMAAQQASALRAAQEAAAQDAAAARDAAEIAAQQRAAADAALRAASDAASQRAAQEAAARAAQAEARARDMEKAARAAAAAAASGGHFEPGTSDNLPGVLPAQSGDVSAGGGSSSGSSSNAGVILAFAAAFLLGA